MKWSSKPLPKRLLKLLPWVVLSLVAAFYFTNGRLFKSTSIFLAAGAWSLSIFATQALGNGYIIRSLDKRISWIHKPWTRLLVGFFALVAYSLIAFLIVHLSFGYFIFEWWTGFEAMTRAFWSEFYYSGRIAVVISLIISVVLTSVSFLQGWRAETIRSAELEKAMAEQRYEALLSKLDPHFLFNSLNVLSEMVHSAPDEAVRFIRKMSDVYRYVLDQGKQEVVSVEEELRFVDAYLDLLKERYGKALVVKRSIDDLDALPRGYLLPMSVQLLVENAVKHNAASAKEPLTIHLEVRGQSLCVRNNLRPKLRETSGKGLGLQFLQERYKSLGQGEPHITHSENTFEVCLPVLHIS